MKQPSTTIITASATIALLLSVIAHGALVATWRAEADMREARIVDAITREDFAISVDDLTTDQRLAYVALLVDAPISTAVETVETNVSKGE